MGAKEDIFEKLNKAMLWAEEDAAAKLATEALVAKIDPKDMIKLCQAILSVPTDRRVDKSRDVVFSDMAFPSERQSA